MTSKSKVKGNAFERDICKYLISAYGGSFTRVPDSGAFTGGKNAHRRSTLSEGQIRAHKGDIIPPDEWVKFNCECKSYASFPFHRLLFNGPVPQLEGWLEQLMEASDPGDFDVLFFKITRIGKFIATKLQYGLDSNQCIVYTDKNKTQWMITEFDDFFSLNKDKFELLSMNG